MARRSNQSNRTEAPQEAAVTTTVEAPTEAPDTDIPESTPEATPEASAAAETPKAPVDLTAFKKAAQNAAENADTATGAIAVAFVEPVVKEYRTLEGLKAKNAAKTWLGEQMKEQMNADSIQGARSYLQLSESMTAGSSGSGSGTPKAPADPTEAFVQAEATLRLAQELHEPGEGVAEDNEAKVEALIESSRESAVAYKAWLSSEAEDKGDEPEASAVVKNAVKLASGKSAKAGARTGGGTTFTGERRDIGKHIAEAFAKVESGKFLTVAEIKNFESSEYTANSPASAGAISARLFPTSGKCTVEGVTPGTNDKGNKGATKN